MGIKAKLDEINAAHAVIRGILESVLAQAIRDLEGRDPSKYELYNNGTESGLFIYEEGMVCLQAMTKGDCFDYGPQIKIPMDVIDNDTVAQWIVEEKARRNQKAEEEAQADAARWAAQRAGRSRIFRGGI